MTCSTARTGLCLVCMLVPAAMLVGCQNGKMPRPFWETQRPAPALYELTDIPYDDSARELPPKRVKADSAAIRSRQKTTPDGSRKMPLRTVTLGYSVKGTPIVMYVIGVEPRPLLIFGGIHGDEPTSAELTRKLLEHVKGNPAVLQSRSVAIIPAANPDGMARGTRQNANKVDCNRNFPSRNWKKESPKSRYYSGSGPASEPETRALMKAVEMLRPRAVISVHSIIGKRFCNNYDGPAKSLAQAMARYNHYPVKSDIGHPTPGSFGTWAGTERGIPIVTLELPAEQKTWSQWWPGNSQALLTAVRQANPSHIADLPSGDAPVRASVGR